MPRKGNKVRTSWIRIQLVVLVALLAALTGPGEKAYAAQSQMGKDGITNDSSSHSRVSKPTAGGGHPCPSSTSGTKIVDGCPDDWQGIAPLIIDELGDMRPGGLDLLNVWVDNDAKFLYILQEFSEAPVNNSYLLLNTDRNGGTGCTVNGMGFEFGVTFSPEESPEMSYIGDARSCGWSNGDFPGALVFAVNGRFLEASIPLNVLNSLGLVTEIEIFCNNDGCEPATYKIKSGPPQPRQGVGGTLKGLRPFFSGLYAVTCVNMRTQQQVWGNPSSPHWNCKDLGLQFEPYDIVLTGGFGRVPK